MTQPILEALRTATAIADQLADPETVSPLGNGRRRPQSLAGGAAGIALLHIERARSGHGAWATARAWLSVAARDELSTGPNANLFFGAPTLAFITHTAADGLTKYTQALDRLDRATITLTRRRLDAAHARIDRGDRPPLAEFDLIRGLAGLSTYHLHRHPDHDITRALLTYLVRLTEPLHGHDDLPGWWTTVAPNGEPSPDFPGGHGNLGMSHGIAAPLAALATAIRLGVVVDGHTDAITRICMWLHERQRQHPTGPLWPGFDTPDQSDHGEPVRQRPSWCYGTPGLARALQLAALATGDRQRQRTAEAAMLACLRDPDQIGQLTDSGLCHGTAGMLQAVWRMSHDALTPDLAAALPALTDRLLTQLRSTPPDAEFLDGRAGIALALHTIGTDTISPAPWDACLMLA